MRIVIEGEAPSIGDSIILAVDVEAMQMFTGPIEGNLNILMELGDVGTTGNQQTPPDHRADTGQHESQSINRWRLLNVAHTRGYRANYFTADFSPESNAPKRGRREFTVQGLTWIVERTFAWLGRNRRFSKDYEYRVQSSETMLEIAAIRLMLNRLVLP